MKIQKSIFLVALPGFLLSGCQTFYSARSVQYKEYRITSGHPVDSAYVQMLKPYGDSVNKIMNEVIGEVGQVLEKKIPEGSLGNFMADAYLELAREKFKIKVDAAFMNHGGIRLNEIPAGPLTRGKVFELMPFDNLLQLQTMKGELLQQYLDYLAGANGAAVSGLSMEISNKKAVNVKINGEPLNREKSYVIANSDYSIINTEVLKAIPVRDIGYLMRDAIIEYCGKFTSQGKKITAKTENRVVNVK